MGLKFAGSGEQIQGHAHTKWKAKCKSQAIRRENNKINIGTGVNHVTFCCRKLRRDLKEK
jgi:hypothetical protein